MVECEVEFNADLVQGLIIVKLLFFDLKPRSGAKFIPRFDISKKKKYRLQREIAPNTNEKVTIVTKLKSRVIKYPLFQARVCVS